MRTHWKCEACGLVGVVTHADDADYYAVSQRVVADHDRDGTCDKWYKIRVRLNEPVDYVKLQIVK
jgi:hypothetical protein